MLSFKKKTTPLTEILKAADKLSHDLMQLKKDKKFHPTEDDLVMLKRVYEKLHHAYAVAGYVHRTMEQRFEGLPEGVTKFNNPEALDYHYPD
jgi:hypothetical protein